MARSLAARAPSRRHLAALGVLALCALFVTGYAETGTPYERPGRATVVLGRGAPGEEWVAQHTHVSLFPGTPSRSIGTKREHPPAL